MKNYITNWQISFVLYCIIVGYGIINLPVSTAKAGDTGGWITILIITVIFIPITYILTYLQYEHEGKTLYEYSQQLVGKFVTYIFSTIYTIYFFLYFTMLVRIYCETIGLYILTKTPVIYLSILFYIASGYAIMKGFVAIARLCQIYGFLNIIITILLSLILFTQGKMVNITPIFDPDDIITYFKAVPKMITPFLGMEILILIPISKSINKNLSKYTTLMVVFIGIFYVLVVESVISVTGVEQIVYQKASILLVAKGIDISYLDFLRRLDGIYILAWSLNIVCAASLWGCGAITFINKIIKNVRCNFIAIAVIILSFIISQIPKTMDQVELIIKYNSYGGIMTFFIIPCVLLLITKVKKYDKKI